MSHLTYSALLRGFIALDPAYANAKLQSLREWVRRGWNVTSAAWWSMTHTAAADSDMVDSIRMATEQDEALPTYRRTAGLAVMLGGLHAEPI